MVAAYIRVSTAEQAVHGLSIEAQTAALDDWAKTQNLVFYDHYTDAGISARKPASKRPELQRLLEDVKGGQVDRIVFTKLDRWFRNISEYYKVQEILEQHHCNWMTIHEDYDTATASGRLKINIMLSVAQDEADRTSERLKAVFEMKRAKGEVLSNHVNLGFRCINSRMEIDPQTAPVARDLFQTYIRTRSISATRKHAAQKYGIIRSHQNMAAMLSARDYLGELYGVQVCEPLIAPQDFALVQEIMKLRSQRNTAPQNHAWLFRGILRCPQCGKSLIGKKNRPVSRRGEKVYDYNRTYYYYRCPDHTLGVCSYGETIREQTVETQLREKLLDACIDYNVRLSESAKYEKTVDTAAIRRKMEKLKDLYLNDLIDRELYARDYLALQNLLAAAARPNRRPIDIDDIRETLNSYETLTDWGRKEFWTRTVSRATLLDGELSFLLVAP